MAPSRTGNGTNAAAAAGGTSKMAYLRLWLLAVVGLSLAALSVNMLYSLSGSDSKPLVSEEKPNSKLSMLRVRTARQAALDSGTQTRWLSKAATRASTGPTEAAHDENIAPEKSLRILYFTMDVLQWWRENAMNGGPKGEIVVTDALLKALRTLGHKVMVAASDEEFAQFLREANNDFDLFFFDGYTAFDSAMRPRDILKHRIEDSFIVDYFGTFDATILKRHGFKEQQVLTAMAGNSPSMTYLGIYLDDAPVPESDYKENQMYGILWGKEQDKSSGTLLHTIIEETTQYAELWTSFRYFQRSDSTRHIGIRTREEYRDLLQKSRFFLGTGDPMLGPSALEAIHAGSLLIIPRYNPPRLLHKRIPSHSQHDFAVSRAPKDRVCLYDLHPIRNGTLKDCILRALKRKRPLPYNFPELSWNSYLARVKEILSKWSSRKSIDPQRRTEQHATGKLLTTKLNRLSRLERGGLKVLYFTLDTLVSWRRNALTGGPKGEIVISDALIKALRFLNHYVDVVTSDQEFEALTAGSLASEYDLFFFDQQTLFESNLRPRQFVASRPGDVFILDYFGASDVARKFPGFQEHHLLTAMGGRRPITTYLGFYLNQSSNAVRRPYYNNTRSFGLVWGKQMDRGNPSFDDILFEAAKFAHLETHYYYYARNVHRPVRTSSIGHMSRESFMAKLSEARFMLGTGDPILGPSALEAVQAGCFLIIPRYRTPRILGDMLKVETQHDFVVARTPSDRYCLYDLPLEDPASLTACLERAMLVEAPRPYLYPELRWENYLKRVQAILKRWQEESESTIPI